MCSLNLILDEWKYCSKKIISEKFNILFLFGGSKQLWLSIVRLKKVSFLPMILVWLNVVRHEMRCSAWRVISNDFILNVQTSNLLKINRCVNQAYMNHCSIEMMKSLLCWFNASLFGKLNRRNNLIHWTQRTFFGFWKIKKRKHKNKVVQFTVKSTFRKLKYIKVDSVQKVLAFSLNQLIFTTQAYAPHTTIAVGTFFLFFFKIYTLHTLKCDEYSMNDQLLFSSHEILVCYCNWMSI